MRKLAPCVVGILALAAACRCSQAAGDTAPQVIPLDAGWRFSLGDPAGAEKPGFDDTAWRKLDVPHDWSIEGAIDVGNPSGTEGAFLPTGVAWYRKTLPSLSSPVSYIEFDGIMANATVYLNGQKLGERPNGYSTVRYRLAPLLSAPATNEIAVRADTSVQPASRWYAGSGITRHVRLIEMNGIHFGSPDSGNLSNAFVQTVEANEKSAVIRFNTSVFAENIPEVTNRKEAQSLTVQIEILKPDGTRQSLMDAPMKVDSDYLTQSVTIDRPRLWGAGGGEKSPMYQAILRLKEDKGGTILDDQVIPFGIRTAEFKPETGFWLNGQNLKLQGVCLHLDGGGVGAAVPMGVWERRLDALRSLGVNAVRTSHNPPDPAFLDLLDRKGFLVMHEIFDTWNTAKLRGDYARFFKDNWQRDLTDAVTRDRNHPSIVIYSAGNEIHDSAAAQLKLFPQIRDLYHTLDPTRPVTLAMLQADRPGNGFSNGLAQLQDVTGANYRPAQLVALARANPGMRVIETETNYGAPELPGLRDNPELAGAFLWTGVDYLGEGLSDTGIAQGFGLLDRTGAIRARGYEHAAWWSSAPMVKIARVAGSGKVGNRDIGGGRVCDWTPTNQQAHVENVEVYSNCDAVELFLNGQSLGSKTKPANVTRTWQVPFAAGTIKAVAKNKGAVAANDQMLTAGVAAKVALTADQKTLTTAWDDVVYLQASIADAAGVTNPNAGNKVTFEINGPGVIMAVDNADLDSHESFRGNQRSTYAGTCIAVIKATGPGAITVQAHANGLADSERIAINGP